MAKELSSGANSTGTSKTTIHTTVPPVVKKWYIEKGISPQTALIIFKEFFSNFTMDKFLKLQSTMENLDKFGSMVSSLKHTIDLLQQKLISIEKGLQNQIIEFNKAREEFRKDLQEMQMKIASTIRQIKEVQNIFDKDLMLKLLRNIKSIQNDYMKIRQSITDEEQKQFLSNLMRRIQEIDNLLRIYSPEAYNEVFSLIGKELEEGRSP